MLLYKYTDLDTALKIIESCSFRYTQPISFNDPFEASPIAEKNINYSEFDNYIDNQINSEEIFNEFYTNFISEQYEKLSDEEKNKKPFSVFYKECSKELIYEMGKLEVPVVSLLKKRFQIILPKMVKPFMNIYSKLVSSTTGIFCLSKLNDNILMWSHYADGHLGVVFEIDTDIVFFKNLKKVKYSEQRPEMYPFAKDYDNDEIQELVDKIYFTKSVSWKYEDEYRDYKLLTEGLNTKIIDKFKSEVYLFSFPPQIIKGIIFGSKLTPQNKLDIQELIKKMGTNEIQLKEAILNDDLFKIEIKPFNSN